MSRIIMHRFPLAAILALVIAACGGEKKSADDLSAGSRAPESSAAPGAAASGGEAAGRDTTTEKIKIKGADDKRVLEVELRGKDVELELGEEGGAVLRGDLRDSGKRKYTVEGGRVFAEVKSDADAFKLRTIEGKLLWKVKLDGDKIKISDNEENAHPYVLKGSGDDIKIEEDERRLGEIKFYADRGKVKVKDDAGTERFESNTARRSAMYGLLLMDRIPETERAIIMAELLLHGR